MEPTILTSVVDEIDGPTAAATAVFAHLEQAWNDADGHAFAEVFVADAEFVDVRGGHHHGADEVAAGHQALFDSVYAGSEVRYRVSRVRSLAPGAIVAVVSGTLTAPAGPNPGGTPCRITATMVEHADRWAIVAFHNTIVVEAT